MFKQTAEPEVPTTELFIDIVIGRVPRCEKHPSARGYAEDPCYLLPISIIKGANRQDNFGVCNWRARQAGFVGEPAPKPKKSTQWNRT